MLSVGEHGLQGRKIAGQFAAVYTPTFAFVRADGQLQNVILGESDEQQLRTAIEALLKES